MKPNNRQMTQLMKNPLKAHELKLLRGFLFLTQEEAASVAGVEVGYWAGVESGSVEATGEGDDDILELIQWRANMVSAAVKKYAGAAAETDEDDDEAATLVLYNNANDFERGTGYSAVYYKPYLSFCAEMLGRGWIIKEVVKSESKSK